MRYSILQLFRGMSTLLLFLWGGDIYNLKQSYLRHPSKLKKFIYYSYLSGFGCSININSRTPYKLIFPHGYFGIFISRNAQIGKDVVIFQQVTIGSNTLKGSSKLGSPIIGDNVYIGAGAKIIGNIKIGNNVRIGANCIVTFDVEDNSTVVLNKPRVIVKEGVLDNEFISINKIS